MVQINGTAYLCSEDDLEQFAKVIIEEFIKKHSWESKEYVTLKDLEKRFGISYGVSRKLMKENSITEGQRKVNEKTFKRVDVEEALREKGYAI